MIKTILLQAAQDGGIPMNIIFLVGIFAVFYFFIIRPQQKKQKDLKKFVENIKKGDNVVTIGGLHGIVNAVENDKVILEVDKGTKLTFNKSAISSDAANQEKK